MVFMTKTMTEAQIKTAARKVAKKAKALRAKGDLAGADRLVREAAENVMEMRSAGVVA